MGSINRVYSCVVSEYVFHCEDDWEFYRTGFLSSSLKLLKQFPLMSMVSLRPRHELNPKVKHQPKLSFEDIEYFQADPQAHPEYFSYSFNPGLRRTKEFKNLGDVSKIHSEAEVSLRFKKLGFYLGYLEDSAVRHIGDDRHVEDPTRPPKAKTFLQRMKRSIRKRWARLKRLLEKD
jgi:hypothetical protein